MKKALQEQIDEKQRKKDIEKMKNKAEEVRDEQRVRYEMRALAVSEGMAPEGGAQAQEVTAANYELGNQPYNPQMQGSTVYNQNLRSTGEAINLDGSLAARKTAYAANQHSISIIGSDIGRTHLPSNLATGDPRLQQNNPNGSPRQNEIAGPGDRIPRSPPGG